MLMRPMLERLTSPVCQPRVRAHMHASNEDLGLELDDRRAAGVRSYRPETLLKAIVSSLFG